MRAYHLTFRCPDIATQEDAEIVRERLVSTAGVGDIEIDWRSKTVRVASSAQDEGASVYKALIDSGFPPED